MQSYVRTEMLPALPPPNARRGVVGWARENLFATPVNAILTLLALAALAWFLSFALPWLLHSVWNADSYLQCLDIIAQAYGPDASGACLAVIRERWDQYIFGFYPRSEWWRPILCMGLLLTILVPLLFSDDAGNARRVIGPVAILTLLALGDAAAPVAVIVLAAVFFLLAVATSDRPGRLIGATALYPFVAVWLLWGGAIWGPVLALAGFMVMALVYRALSSRVGVPMATGLGLVAAVVWWILIQPQIGAALSAALPWGLAPVESDKFGGFLLAFVIGVSSIGMALPLGILLALGRRSDLFIVHALAVGFIEFVRGVPLITMLFTASLLLQYFLPPQVQFDLILRVIILVTVFSAAYIAEVIRGGLAGLPKGQGEAADSLGLDYWQAQRLIILPQALKISIPGIVNVFIGLFKDTTLVSFVGLMDPLRGVTAIVRADIDWKGAYWEPYLFVAVIFFIACFGMSRYALYLEGRLKTDHR